MDTHCKICGSTPCNCRGGKCLCGMTPEQFTETNKTYETSEVYLQRQEKAQQRVSQEQGMLKECYDKNSPRCKCKQCGEFWFYHGATCKS